MIDIDDIDDIDKLMTDAERFTFLHSTLLRMLACEHKMFDRIQAIEIRLCEHELKAQGWSGVFTPDKDHLEAVKRYMAERLKDEDSNGH